ncbi:bark storage protein A-like isoform X1 [Henckelia pumila]|uniref:bark storage protein A-like isoform X1 n=2 Tax=Henckelia pumila TaxID=405737 RepID=UPI003C6DBF4C
MAAFKCFKFSFSQLFLPSLLVFHALGFPLQRLRSLEIIREINSKGPYLGLITVYSLEEDAFFSSGVFEPDSQNPFLDLSGRRFRVGKLQRKEVIYVKCGVGMVNAAAATQQMLDLFNIEGLIHFGISGNLNSSMNIGDVVIPNQFANTGLWDWLKPDAQVPKNDFAKLEVKEYNVPRGGNSSLGMIGYRAEQFYSDAGEVDTAQQMLWFNVTSNWLQLASALQGLELDKCVNSSLCLVNKPKVVLGMKASTANIFLDNGAYRNFLFQTFGVSSADMESTAVVMTSLSNGFPVLVIRGLSDLAGAQEGQNSIHLFGSLAASNVAKVVIQFINLLPNTFYRHS